MTQKLPIPTEHEECLVFVEWLEYQKNLGNVLLFTHIPNETPAGHIQNGHWQTHNKTTGKNYAAGVRAGICDYLLITAAGKFLGIEMKRIRGSRTSDDQREWIDALNTCEPSCHARVCRGSGEAIEFVEEFLPAK